MTLAGDFVCCLSTSEQAEVYLASPSDVWLYYFSTLAQSVAAGSSLFLAILLIRLQALQNSLAVVERSLSEVFHRSAEDARYSSILTETVLNQDWKKYFERVEAAANELGSMKFGKDYLISRAYFESLVMRGISMMATAHKIEIALRVSFMLTIALSGLSILAIPLAMWASAISVKIAWIVSGAVFIIICWLTYTFVQRVF